MADAHTPAEPPLAAQPARPRQRPRDVRNISLTVIAVVAVIWLLKNAQEVLIPFVVSGMLFYALDPFVDRLQQWRIPRVIGATLMLLVVLAAAGVTMYKLTDQLVAVVGQVPAGVSKLRDEISETARRRGAIETVQEAAEAIDRTTAETAQPAPAPRGVLRVQIEEPSMRVADYLWSGWMSVPGAVSVVVMIAFLTLFLLVADDLFKRKLVKNVGSGLADKRLAVQVLDEIGSHMKRFILVQIFTSVIVAVVTGLTLWWLGLNQPAVWGLLAGLFNSVPYFGPVIVSVGLSVVGYVQFGAVGPTAAVALAALAITTLEGWVLTPILLGRVAAMNPIAIFAGLLFWTWMWGVWGMLLAVPIMMAAKVVCDHVEPLRPIGDFLGE